MEQLGRGGARLRGGGDEPPVERLGAHEVARGLVETGEGVERRGSSGRAAEPLERDAGLREELVAVVREAEKQVGGALQDVGIVG